MSFYNRRPSHTTGCYYSPPSASHYGEWKQLPIVECKAKTSIKGSASRTLLKQYFTNATNADIGKCQYAFPLYDGVSVVSFKAQIGSKVLEGIVKEREEAKQEFDAAVAKGESAGLMEQNLSASDVFNTTLGNIPKDSTAIVTVEYIHELQHDLETDSLKFEMPTGIAPRYGATNDYPISSVQPRGFEWTCDINSPSPITKVDSPSHSVSVTLGQLSTEDESHEPDFRKCSVTMSLQKETGLSKELILTVKSKGIKDPVALWETHPTVKNHSALMTTLVPNFALPQIKPEVVFVCDRSGSMQGQAIETLVDALRVMLHSLPANGIKFNICSFGSGCDFLFKKSEAYSKTTLQQAIQHLGTFDAAYGGTETEKAVRATIEQRYGDIPLEIILMTDGDIWNQGSMFTYLNEKVVESKQQIRVFPLGIGHGVSSALIEGVARAGNGFASTVMPGERMDQRCMRMLKAALSPHITDYRLEVQYEQEPEDDFEIVQSVQEANEVALHLKAKTQEKKTISLFDTSANADDTPMADVNANTPDVAARKALQAPFSIPPLYAFSRTIVYLLLGHESAQRVPKTVILKGTLEGNELKLEIPVIDVGCFRTVHQLAARRAVQDLEEGRGWPFVAKTQDGKSIQEAHPSSFEDVVKAEAVRLGTTFQVMNRWCSYVARERAARDKDAKKGSKDTSEPPPYTSQGTYLTPEEDDEENMSFSSFDALAAVPPPPPSASNIARQALETQFDSVSSAPVPNSMVGVLRSTSSGAGLFGSPSQVARAGGVYGSAAPGSGSSALFASNSPSQSFRSPFQGLSSGGLFGNFMTGNSKPPSPPAQRAMRSAGVSTTASLPKPLEIEPLVQSLPPTFGDQNVVPAGSSAPIPAPAQGPGSHNETLTELVSDSTFSKMDDHLEQFNLDALIDGGDANRVASRTWDSPSTGNKHPQPGSQTRLRRMKRTNTANDDDDGYWSSTSAEEPAIHPEGTIGEDAKFDSQSRNSRKRREEHGRDRDRDVHSSVVAPASSTKPPPPFSTDAARVRYILTLQEFDGSFETSGGTIESLAHAMSVDKRTITMNAGIKRVDEVVWTTALVVAYLEARMAGEVEIWEMSVEKARMWLEGKSVYVKVILEKAKEVLGI